MTEWYCTHDSTVISNISKYSTENSRKNTIHIRFKRRCFSPFFYLVAPSCLDMPSFQAPLAAGADSVQKGKSLGFANASFRLVQENMAKHGSNHHAKNWCIIAIIIVWSQYGVDLFHVLEFPVPFGRGSCSTVPVSQADQCHLASSWTSPVIVGSCLISRHGNTANVGFLQAIWSIQGGLTPENLQEQNQRQLRYQKTVEWLPSAPFKKLESVQTLLTKGCPQLWLTK